jgi:hypothetical protein
VLEAPGLEPEHLGHAEAAFVPTDLIAMHSED